MTERTSSFCGLIVTPEATSQSTMRSEKLSAAKALPKKPARVIPTWIVAKKRAGCWVRERRRFAWLHPLSASFLSLLSLIEMTAISAQAKRALRRIRKN